MDTIDLSFLNENLLLKLNKVKLFSCRKIILMNDNGFRKIGIFTEGDVKELRSAAAKTLYKSEFITANEASTVYKERWKNITFDCLQIDEVMGGGLPCWGITELYGESGAGKTQFALQLSITVQYPRELGGLDSGAVFICTEDRFPSKRLHQLSAFFPRNKPLKGEVAQIPFTDNVLVDHIMDLEGLKDCVFKRLPLLMIRNKIGLVVIDSIAAIFRAEYTFNQSVVRAKAIREIGVQLHRISRKFKAAVLCINQVTDSVETGETVPALGLAWANLVTNKLQIRAVSYGGRVFKIITSPHLPSSSCNFEITKLGIEAHEETETL